MRRCEPNSSLRPRRIRPSKVHFIPATSKSLPSINWCFSLFTRIIQPRSKTNGLWRMKTVTYSREAGGSSG